MIDMSPYFKIVQLGRARYVLFHTPTQHYLGKKLTFRTREQAARFSMALEALPVMWDDAGLGSVKHLEPYILDAYRRVTAGAR